MPDRDTRFDPADTATDVDQVRVACPHCAGRIIVSRNRAWCAKSYATGGCGAAWSVQSGQWMWNPFGVAYWSPAHHFSPNEITRCLPELRRRLGET